MSDIGPMEWLALAKTVKMDFMVEIQLPLVVISKWFEMMEKARYKNVNSYWCSVLGFLFKQENTPAFL